MLISPPPPPQIKKCLSLFPCTSFSLEFFKGLITMNTHRAVNSAQTHRAVSSAHTASTKTKHSFSSLAFTLFLMRNHEGASNTLYCQGNSYLSLFLSWYRHPVIFITQCVYLLSQRTQLRTNSFHVPLCACVS